MSNFDESKVRREQGKFANKDQTRDEAGQLEDAFTEHCPLCGDPIDYCQGHGEFNVSEEMTGSEIRPGDRVFDHGTVETIRHDDGDMVFTTDDGNEYRVGMDETLHVLSDERENFTVEDFNVSHDIHKGAMDAQWNVTLTGEQGQFTTQFYHPIDRHGTPPSMDEVMDELAEKARDIDGVSYEEFCERQGYYPEDDLHYEYNEAVDLAGNLHAVLGDEGYAAMVFGSRDAEFDIPTGTRAPEPVVHEPAEHDDSKYRDSIYELRDESAEDSEQWYRGLAEMHGYDITDDDAEPATDSSGWQHISHKVELTDPDNGRTIRLDYNRGLATSPPDAADIMCTYANDLSYARDYNWDAHDMAEALGYDPYEEPEKVKELERHFAKLREFEAFLGDRTDLYMGLGD